MATSLSDVLDRGALRRMGGARSFRRGEGYFSAGQVVSLAEDGRTLKATVQGTQLYRVGLWVKAGELEYSCSCPVGTDGSFCKHCVAAGLASLDQRAGAHAARKRRPNPAVTMADVRKWLAGREKVALIGMLLGRANEDTRLRQQLLMHAAKTRPKGPDVATFREALARAVDPRALHGYGDRYEYIRGVEDAIDGIEGLLKEGHAAAVVDLVEKAVEKVEEALNSIDDSDGFLGGILERLQKVHLAACRKAKPDPETLAGRLFEREHRGEWGTFADVVQKYARVLGKEGLAAYRRLAEAEWARVSELGPGQRDPEQYGKRFRLTQIMEALAKQTRDVEALVAIKKRDLSSSHGYLQIAETYRDARKHDLALEWAEKGLKAFPDRSAAGLREFLAEEYHRRKRHDDAMALVWEDFLWLTDLERYERLKVHADRCGQWKTWREKALAQLRKECAKPRRGRAGDRNGWDAVADRSELVKVFLWEGDVDAAWREARAGGCFDGLWLELAGKREKKHPEDALSVYQAQVEPVLARTDTESYREAIGLLRKVRALMIRLGGRQGFERYRDGLRETHRRKRNFVKMLDRARW